MLNKNWLLYLCAEWLETPDLLQLMSINRELFHLIAYDHLTWRKACIRFTDKGTTHRQEKRWYDKEFICYNEGDAITTQYDLVFQKIITNYHALQIVKINKHKPQRHAQHLEVATTEKRLDWEDSSTLLNLMFTLLKKTDECVYVNEAIFRNNRRIKRTQYGFTIFPLAIQGQDHEPVFVTSPATLCDIQFRVYSEKKSNWDDPGYADGGLTDWGLSNHGYSGNFNFTGSMTKAVFETLHMKIIEDALEYFEDIEYNRPAPIIVRLLLWIDDRLVYH